MKRLWFWVRFAIIVLALLAVAVISRAECEDENGFVFSDPQAFVDGLRPQGLCLPPGTREEWALRNRGREEAHTYRNWKRALKRDGWRIDDHEHIRPPVYP